MAAGKVQAGEAPARHHFARTARKGDGLNRTRIRVGRLMDYRKEGEFTSGQKLRLHVPDFSILQIGHADLRVRRRRTRPH